jgi:hypothetical protein
MQLIALIQVSCDREIAIDKVNSLPMYESSEPGPSRRAQSERGWGTFRPLDSGQKLRAKGTIVWVLERGGFTAG